MEHKEEENSERQSIEIDQTAHLLGNYHKYYTFHSVESRVSLLEKKQVFHSLWKSFQEPSTFSYLDIGCNEGDLTYGIYRTIRAELPESVQVNVVGVDIDGDLIQLANNKYSSNRPIPSSSEAPLPEITNIDRIHFANIDFTNETMITAFRERLVNEWQIMKTSDNFQFISVFSTTMWIHINHGDEGLRKFFKDVKTFLFPHFSALLVEPQPPKCYTNAARRCRKLRISYPPYLEKVDRSQALTLLKDIITKDLLLSSSYYFGKEEWGRTLNLYYEDSVVLTIDVEKASS